VYTAKHLKTGLSSLLAPCIAIIWYDKLVWFRGETKGLEW